MAAPIADKIILPTVGTNRVIAELMSTVPTAHALYQREWRKLHPGRAKIYKDRYRATQKGEQIERMYALKYIAEGGTVATSRRYRENNPEKYKAVKQAYVAQCRARINAAKANPCVDCGGRFPPECMDFDHVRGSKVGDVAKMIDYSPAKLEAEIAKCELVCANCHRIRTKARRVQ